MKKKFGNHNNSNKKYKNRSKLFKRACFIYYMQFNNSALLYREAKALQSRGFEVDVIDLRSSRKENIFQTFDGINIYGIQPRPFAEKKMLLYFVRLLLFCVKATFFLAIMSLKRRYNLIHVTAPPDFMVFTALIPKLLGAKIILDIHDISPEFFMEKMHIKEDRMIIKLIKFVEAISTKFADHVITVTDHWRNKLISRSVPQAKCTVLLNVPDDDFFKPIPNNETKPLNMFNLFYHGSLEEYFGVDTIIKAMPFIKQNIPNVRLHIYGGGRLKEYFEAWVDEKGYDSYIKIYNKVPFYMLPQILVNAHLGIVPTKNSNFSDDTISMKSLEYIALGIPVVISATSAHQYYFDNSMVSFFEPENEIELASCVIKLYKNEQERKHLVRRSYAFLRQHGWRQSKNIYFQIIEKLNGNGLHNFHEEKCLEKSATV